MAHLTVSRRGLVLRRISRLGVLLVSGLMLGAFIVGWLTGTVLQLATAYMPRMESRHALRLRMASAIQRVRARYKLLLHPRVL